MWIDANNYCYVTKSNNGAANKIYYVWQSQAGGIENGGVTADFAANDVLVIALTMNDDTNDVKLYVNGKKTDEDLGAADTLVGTASHLNIAADWDGNNNMDAWFGVFVNLPVALNERQIAKMTNLLGDLYDGQIVTANSGTGTITAAVTTDVITHGLSLTPDIDKIRVVYTENPTNDVGTTYIDTVTATQFTVNVENVPGASALDFAWS